MADKKYEKPLAIDMPFEEALERLAGTNPKAMRRVAPTDGQNSRWFGMGRLGAKLR